MEFNDRRLVFSSLSREPGAPPPPREHGLSREDAVDQLIRPGEINPVHFANIQRRIHESGFPVERLHRPVAIDMVHPDLVPGYTGLFSARKSRDSDLLTLTSPHKPHVMFHELRHAVANNALQGPYWHAASEGRADRAGLEYSARGASPPTGYAEFARNYQKGWINPRDRAQIPAWAWPNPRHWVHSYLSHLNRPSMHGAPPLRDPLPKTLQLQSRGRTFSSM